MMGWFKKKVAAKVAAKVELVVERPKWSSVDAANLRAFLASNTGVAMVAWMQVNLLEGCMRRDIDPADLATIRAIQKQILMMRGLADVQHFSQLEANNLPPDDKFLFDDEDAE